MVAADRDSSIDEDCEGVVTQVIRILCDRQYDRKVDVGAGGCLDYAAYAARLVATKPSCADARAVQSRSARAALRAVDTPACPIQPPPGAEIQDLILRHQCNLYGVCGAGGELIGEASFAGFFHLFNHSCAPNLIFDSAGRRYGLASSTPYIQTPEFDLLAARDIAGGEYILYWNSW